MFYKKMTKKRGQGEHLYEWCFFKGNNCCDETIMKFQPVRIFRERPAPAASLPILFFVSFLFFGCAVTPKPFSPDELAGKADQGRTRLYRDQESITGRVSQYEAMARALKYNLDHRIKEMEKALAEGNLETARYDLLPELVASAGYSDRNNDYGSSSRSLLSGRQSLEPSTSQPREQFNASIIHVWNVLDFGVSYTRALQRADEILIAEEWRRKAVQNIIQDVRFAYWRAVSAEMLLPRMDTLLKRVEEALERARRLEEARIQEPAKVLTYQQTLLETLIELWRMRKELALAKTELAALMNVDPAADFQLLPEPEQVFLPGPGEILSMQVLEEYALVNRPELRAEMYQQRVSGLEVRKALLGMLPGLEINLAAHYDDNSYLYNNSWLQAGLSLSWNVFNLLSGPASLKSAEMQVELTERRYMASAMMVLTQVHLARQRYFLARNEFRIADELDRVHQRKLRHTEAARKAQTGRELEEIRQLASALSAGMQRGIALAEVQASLGRIFHSCGIDPLPRVTDSHAVESLAESIRQYEQEMIQTFGVAGQDRMAGQPDRPVETAPPPPDIRTDEPAAERTSAETASHQVLPEEKSGPAPPAEAASPRSQAADQTEPAGQDQKEESLAARQESRPVPIRLKSEGRGFSGPRGSVLVN